MTHRTWLLFAAAFAGQAGAAAAATQPPAAPPVLVSGTITGAAINVTTAVNKPTVTFKYRSAGTLVAWGFTFTAPHGATHSVGAATVSAPADYYGYYPPAGTAGTIVTNAGGGFSLYSEAGSWTMTGASLADAAGNVTTYNQAQLATLFPGLALTVTNPGKQSINPPVLSAGKLLNTKVSLSSPLPFLAAQVTVASSVAGVYLGQLYLATPNGQPYIDYGTNGPAPVSRGAFQFGDNITAGSPTGTWSIVGYQVCDIVTNCLIDKNPADVTKLFGRSTFTVTN